MHQQALFVIVVEVRTVADVASVVVVSVASVIVVAAAVKGVRAGIER